MHPLIRVVTTGERFWNRDHAGLSVLHLRSGPAPHVEALEPRSPICVPLVNSGKPLGA